MEARGEGKGEQLRGDTAGVAPGAGQALREPFRLSRRVEAAPPVCRARKAGTEAGHAWKPASIEVKVYSFILAQV